jgi:hypothetical protein
MPRCRSDCAADEREWLAAESIRSAVYAVLGGLSEPARRAASDNGVNTIGTCQRL